MSHAGINLENVKVNNRSAILKLLNDQGAMSRKDIASHLGLTPATVSLISSELLAAGVLREIGELKETPRAGRKKILLGLNYDYRYVLTICIEAGDTTLAICNLAGKCLHIKRIPTNTQVAPEEFLLYIASESKALLWENSMDRSLVLGAGVSIPGKVDRKTGLSLFAYRVWERPVEIGKCLQQYLELPVIVENNVRSFAEAELIYGTGKQNDNILFLKWGPGVGSALVIHNQIYDSNLPREPQIGHIIVERGGRLCRCGRRGCLETRVSIHAIAERVRAQCTPQSMPELYKLVEGDLSRITAGSIRWWAQAENEGMRKVFDSTTRQLCWTVCGALSMLVPDKVIVYGQMFELPHFYERFLAFCQQYDASYNEEYVSRSALSGQIDYIGPLAVVVNGMFLSAENTESI